jgi:hypothetical protein
MVGLPARGTGLEVDGRGGGGRHGGGGRTRPSVGREVRRRSRLDTRCRGRRAIVTQNTEFTPRTANPRAAVRPAGDWPPAGRIIMTPYRPPNNYPLRVRLTLDLTCREKTLSTFLNSNSSKTLAFPLSSCLQFFRSESVSGFSSLGFLSAASSGSP